MNEMENSFNEYGICRTLEYFTREVTEYLQSV